MSEVKLKPCPFCEGVSRMRSYQIAEDEVEAFVECEWCGGRGPVYQAPYAPHGDAFYRWNTRPREQALLEALEEAMGWNWLDEEHPPSGDGPDMCRDLIKQYRGE